jgi:hypothetical protein
MVGLEDRVALLVMVAMALMAMRPTAMAVAVVTAEALG